MFDTVQPGSKVPVGMDQFERDLVTARQYRQNTGKTMQVEHALLLTFSKAKIEVSSL